MTKDAPLQQVVATATHANARSFHAFSRDKGMPDRGLFTKLARNKVPINAVWLVLFIAGESAIWAVRSSRTALLILLLCAMQLSWACLSSRPMLPSTPSLRWPPWLWVSGLSRPHPLPSSPQDVVERKQIKTNFSAPADASYVIPIACSVWFADHPEVMFTPGPFYLGKTWYGYLGAFSLPCLCTRRPGLSES